MENFKNCILSVDAETNGLWGNSFSIAAILFNERGNELDKICLRVPDSFVTNEWVKINVIPTLDFPITHQNREEMLKAFADFYLKYKDCGEVLWHMGHVVEAQLFRELVKLNLIGEWDAPYTPIEVSEALRGLGFAPDSVDSYIKEHNIKVKDYGSTHNPLYDCEVAAKVYFHCTANK